MIEHKLNVPIKLTRASTSETEPLLELSVHAFLYLSIVHSSSTLCTDCRTASESWLHILRDCAYAKKVWSMLGMDGSFFTGEGNAWLKEKATKTSMTQTHGIQHNILFLASIWEIWKSRNNLIFDRKRPPEQMTAKYAVNRAIELQEISNSSILTKSKRNPAENRWDPPPTGYLKLNTDGSVIDSTAAAGGILRDHKGRWVAGFAMNIGPASIHESELWGLRQGIFLALQLKITKVVIELDSAEVVDALNSIPTEDLMRQPLLIDCIGLLHGFEDFMVRKISRNQNVAADFLAKRGLKLEHGVYSYDNAPQGLDIIICNEMPGQVPVS